MRSISCARPDWRAAARSTTPSSSPATACSTTTLRYEDEFVRHKVLDAVGDLALAGAPIIGHYHGVRAGHSFNNKLLQALFADEAAWRWAMLDGRTAGAAPWQRRAVAANA